MIPSRHLSYQNIPIFSLLYSPKDINISRRKRSSTYIQKKKKSFRMTSDTLPRGLFSPERTGRFLALGCTGVIFTRISRRLRRSNGYHSNAEYAKTDTHIARPRFYYILFRYASLSLFFSLSFRVFLFVSPFLSRVLFCLLLRLSRQIKIRFFFLSLSPSLLPFILFL